MDGAPGRKRKVDSECRAFNDRWIRGHLFILSKDVPVCLVCTQSVAVSKEFNIKRHYETHHDLSVLTLLGS